MLVPRLSPAGLKNMDFDSMFNVELSSPPRLSHWPCLAHGRAPNTLQITIGSLDVWIFWAQGRAPNTLQITMCSLDVWPFLAQGLAPNTLLINMGSLDCWPFLAQGYFAHHHK